jgi:hypothetical protein
VNLVELLEPDSVRTASNDFQFEENPVNEGSQGYRILVPHKKACQDIVVDLFDVLETDSIRTASNDLQLEPISSA